MPKLVSVLGQFSRGLSGDGAAPQRTGYDATVHRWRAQEAWQLVRIYYAVMLVVMFWQLDNIWENANLAQAVDLRWPVLWMQWLGIKTSATIVLLGMFASGLLGAVFYRHRWARIAVAVFFVQHVALNGSFGYVNNSFHIWMWMSVGFACLPTATAPQLHQNRALRQQSLTVFAWVTGLILLFYTLSGIAKLVGAIPIDPSKMSSLAPDALAHLVLNRLLAADEVSVFGDLLAAAPLAGWPIYLLVIYIEVFAFVALFRPALLWLFGSILVVFHIGIWFFMEIQFPLQPLQALLLLVWSPFRPRNLDWRQILWSLPVLGSALRPVSQATTGRLVYWWQQEWRVFVVIAVLTALDVLPELVKRALA